MPFDPELQKFAHLFYEPIEGQDMPLIGDGATYSRALGWQSPEGNFYGQERWVRDWPVAVVWDGENYRNVEIDGEASSTSNLPMPDQINPNTGMPYGIRQHFEMWAVPRPNWPPEGATIYDARDKEFYYWNSINQEWGHIEWYWSVEGEENLRRPGLHIGAAHILYYYDIKVMWNGYYWTRYKHSMIEDDEPWLHVPEGFISSYNDQLTITSGAIQTLGGDLQSLSGSVVQQFQEAAEQLDLTLDEFRSRVVDARMEFTSKTTLGLYSSVIGKIGALWVNGELLLTEEVIPASNTNQAVIYVGGSIILSSILPNTEYYVYCGNSEFTEFTEALFLSLTPDTNGRLGEDGVGANARIVGTVETDSAGYFIREIDMSIIGRKVEFSKTYWEYSDYQLQFVDQNTLAFNKIDGTSGLIYINGQLLDLGSGRDLDREAYRIEWDIGPDLDTSDILVETTYQIYIANDSIEYNFNSEDPTTGLPYEEGPNYFAFLDFRRQLFLSTKQHDHRLFDQEYPGYYARHIGQVQTDETGYFKYAADISLIRQPTLNPTSLDGLAECVIQDVSTTQFKIIRKKGTTGVVYVGGKPVQTYDTDNPIVHIVNTSDALYTYTESNISSPLADSGLNVENKPGIPIYLYLANDLTAWGGVTTFCSLEAPSGGYLSTNWPGNQARWIATLQLSPATLGSEKVTNGSFATDTAWTKGTGWSYVSADQNMDHAPGNTATLSQNVSAVAGELYACTFYISGRTAGIAAPRVGGASGQSISGNTSSTQYLLAATTGNLEIVPDTYFDGTVDNVSVKKVETGQFSGTYIKDSVSGVSAQIDDAIVSTSTTYSSNKIEQIKQQLLTKINLALGLNGSHTSGLDLILEYVNSTTIRLKAYSSDVDVVFPNLETVTVTTAGITKTVAGNISTLYYVYLVTDGTLAITTNAPTDEYSSISFYGETHVLVGWIGLSATNTIAGNWNVYSFWNQEDEYWEVNITNTATIILGLAGLVVPPNVACVYGRTGVTTGRIASSSTHTHTRNGVFDASIYGVGSITMAPVCMYVSSSLWDDGLTYYEYIRGCYSQWSSLTPYIATGILSAASPYSLGNLSEGVYSEFYITQSTTLNYSAAYHGVSGWDTTGEGCLPVSQAYCNWVGGASTSMFILVASGKLTMSREGNK